MHAADEIASQQRRKGVRVDFVVLVHRLGDDAVLRRVRERHVLHALDPLEQIVERAPVPTRLHDHLARGAQRLDVRLEGFRGVGVDPRFADDAALPVNRAGHRIMFVIIDSGIVTHNVWNMFESPWFSTRLRSYYLTMRQSQRDWRRVGRCFYTQPKPHFLFAVARLTFIVSLRFPS